MPNVSLGPIGLDIAVDLEGQVEMSAGVPPHFVLSAESHNDNNGICQALANALTLLDRGVIDLLAVEEFFERDVREEVTEELRQLRRAAAALPALIEALKKTRTYAVWPARH